MRRLTKTAVLALGLCAAAVLPASAAPPAVGGPKGASMAFGFTATGPQQHVLAETAGNQLPGNIDPEVTDTCTAPRCHAFPFAVAATTKGAKTAEVSAQISWASPTSRFWLQLMDVTKEPSSVAQCFTFYLSAGPSATVRETLKVGHKYAVWVSVEQVAGLSEAVKGIVHAPAKDVAPASRISGADPTGLFLSPCQG